jgi:hypothetical protein
VDAEPVEEAAGQQASAQATQEAPPAIGAGSTTTTTR